jgi:N-acetyl sugar amidotransferase
MNSNFETFDAQLAEFKPVQFCKKCVISNQRPRITFDSAGVCSACNYAAIKHDINWKEREQELIDLLSRHRSKDGSYDCLVPASGGKDSSYVAHQLKHKYGMHPLTITWAPFIYTDIGWKNYVAFKDSGFDNLLFFPNGSIHRKLSRLGFEYVGDNFLPFVYGQKAFVFHVAVKHNLPLIFYGESGEVEYGGSIKNMQKSHETPEDWEELYFKGVGVDQLTEIGIQDDTLTKEEVASTAMTFYRPPPLEEIQRAGAEMHWFSYYHRWLPQENYYYALEHTGFEANKGRSDGTYSKYASLDDKTDSFHYYMGYIKFGLGRATSDAAHEIRDGHISREEGVALVQRYDGERPTMYLKETLDYLNLTEERFEEIVEFYRTKSDHLWKMVGQSWRLRHTVSGDGAEDM